MPERPGIRKKITERLEITYEYHPTKGHSREHWMYVSVTGKDHEDCLEKAKKHYESQIRSLGWGRITTLKEIGPLRNGSSKPPHKVNTELSGSRSPAKSDGSKRTRKKSSPSSRSSRRKTR